MRSGMPERWSRNSRTIPSVRRRVKLSDAWFIQVFVKSSTRAFRDSAPSISVIMMLSDHIPVRDAMRARRDAYGKRGDLLKVLWHDGLGMSHDAKLLERGRFVWPTPNDGAV